MALKDITLGQYFPGKSIIHRFDPRAKLIFLFLFVIALFVSNTALGYGILFAFLALGIGLSRISLSTFRKGLKPIVIIVIFTALMNLLFTHGGETLVSYRFITITTAGVSFALFMVSRVFMLLLSTLLLTYTTSPLMLTDGLDRLLSPLKVLKVPVHDLTMIMSIALRFIPTLIQETDKIISAQKARGADFETGNIFRRARALMPILIPLFISAFRRADELAIAMDCRCYHGGNERTRLRQLKFEGKDIFLLLLSLVLFGGILVLRFVFSL